MIGTATGATMGGGIGTGAGTGALRCGTGGSLIALGMGTLGGAWPTAPIDSY